MPRKWSIIIAAVITSAVSVTPPIVFLQGGDYLPWVIPAFAIVGVEIAAMTVVAIRHYRSPNEQEKRARAKRKKKKGTSPSFVESTE